jgi:membrane protease YdiL (CAAX protease family)
MQTPSEPSSAHQPFPWRLFIFFCLVSIPASVAILPYSLALSANTGMLPNSSSSESVQLFFYALMIVSSAIQAVMYWPLTGIGILAAQSLGLVGAPIFSALLYRRPIGVNVRKIVSSGALVGVAGGIVLMGLNEWIFTPWMEPDLAGTPFAENPPSFTPWQGLLASFSAGFNEELLLRLFLLSSIAWLGQKLLRRPAGMPGNAILWIANLLSALLFGALHLPNATMVGAPLTTATITSILAMNGLIGLAFGWLYWKYGLESAMLAHFLTDVVMKVVAVLIFGAS